MKALKKIKDSGAAKVNQNRSKRFEDVAATSQAEVKVVEAAQKGVESGKDIRVDPSLICADPKQPRRRFNESSIKELAKTIDQAGQLQAVLVVPLDDNSKFKYQLVSGERRWRAISKYCSKVQDIWAVPVSFETRRTILEAQIIENDARENTLVVEKALAYSALIDEYTRDGIKGAAQKVSELLGISKGNMSKYRAIATWGDRLMPLNDKYPKEGLEGLYMLSALFKKDQDKAEQVVARYEGGQGSTPLRSLIGNWDSPEPATGSTEGDSASPSKRRAKSQDVEPTASGKKRNGSDNSAEREQRKFVSDLEFEKTKDGVVLKLYVGSKVIEYLTDESVMDKASTELPEVVV